MNAEMGAAIQSSTTMMYSLYFGRIQKVTGRTAGTIEQLVIGRGTSHVTGYVGSDDAIASILEFGSRPHVISPVVKRALWWPGLGRPVPFVRHPGTIPYLHLSRSAPVAGAIAKTRLRAAFIRALS